MTHEITPFQRLIEHGVVELSPGFEAALYDPLRHRLYPQRQFEDE
ncbi:MAG: hypothetical protein M0037_10125 [Betaproteobacteria bacterium]|nr:hypothetical protein [Betaproteobacteria bacterium]